MDKKLSNSKCANLHKMSKCVQNLQMVPNCAKCTKWCKMCKNVQNLQIVETVQNLQSCAKCVKLCTMFKVVQNIQKCAKYTKTAQNCERLHPFWAEFGAFFLKTWL